MFIGILVTILLVVLIVFVSRSSKNKKLENDRFQSGIWKKPGEGKDADQK